ncbi:MAG: HAD family phosphatase [Mycobacteriales bacterium]
MTGEPVGLLFDMDGLLIDSEGLWTIAESELMVVLGGEWDASIKPLLIGKHVDQTASVFLELSGSAESPQFVIEFLLRRVAELFHAELPLMPGVAVLLDELGRRGVPMAIVSASPRVLVQAALDDIGADRFVTTVAGDEVSAAKPDPEAYLKAAAALGIDPQRCIVLEDSPTGVRAGQAAGCVVIGVPSVAPIPAGPRTFALDSLEGIDVDWLLALPDQV